MATRRDDVPPALQRILLPGESLVVALHAHWAKMIKPVSIALLALVVTLFIDSNVTQASQAIGTIVWWLFFGVLAWLVWQVLEWRHDWFVATDKRLLLRYGLLTHKVAMMPLLKVTDMSYVRTIPGQLLGFGRFVMESAGQDQALRTIDWVPHANETYQAITAEIFHIVPPADELIEISEEGEEGELGGPPGGAPFGGGPFGGEPGYPDVNPIHTPVQDRLDSYSRAMPIQSARPVHRPNPDPTPESAKTVRPAPAVEPTHDGESLYQSEDIRKRRRGADTGPIWPLGGPLGGHLSGPESGSRSTEG